MLAKQQQRTIYLPFAEWEDLPVQDILEPAASEVDLEEMQRREQRALMSIMQHKRRAGGACLLSMFRNAAKVIMVGTAQCTCSSLPSV